MAACPRCGKAVYFGEPRRPPLVVKLERVVAVGDRLEAFSARVFGVLFMSFGCEACGWGFELLALWSERLLRVIDRSDEVRSPPHVHEGVCVDVTKRRCM